MIRPLFFFFLIGCGNVFAQSSSLCTDGNCDLPGASSEILRYSCLAPVGTSAVAKIRQAERLKSLDGKRIAIVGGSFMAYVTHPELKRLFQQEYPKSKIFVLNEIGSAGPWPAPGVIRKQKDEFVQKLRDLKIDAVISGNGGCGLCTPKEAGSCIAAEHAGIPSVMIAAPGFSVQAKNAAQIAGVPVLRVAEYPGAFSAHTEKELLKNTKEVLWPQIKKALTQAFSEDELKAGKVFSEKNQIAFAGTLDEVNFYFSENAWTDGLPIVPPTSERVEAFLKYTDLKADDVVAVIPPANRKASARLVAINGVMAGCPPEFMPILVAFTKAMANGEFRRTLSSTHAWTPYCWLNGPLARQLGLEAGRGEISAQRNAKIGRFINLAMLNLGGYSIRENRMGTFGYLMPWCLVEDEVKALEIGWRPYHLQQGFRLNENVLTAASSLCWGNNLAPASAEPQKIMEMLAWDAVEKQQFALGSGTPFVYRTFLITGNVAKDLAKKFGGKEELESALIDTARRPLQERAYANYWGNPGSSFNPSTYSLQRHAAKIARNEGAKMTVTPPWLQWCGKEKLETVPVMSPGKSAFLITGDENRNKTMCVPGGGFASVKIELPKDWDALMENLGYPPLKKFYLNSDLKPAGKARRSRNFPPKK